MRPSLDSLHVLFAGAAVVTAGFFGCAKGYTLGTGPGEFGGDGEGGGDTLGHQGGSTNGTGGTTSNTTSDTTTSNTTTSNTTTSNTTTTSSGFTTSSTTTGPTTSTAVTTTGGGACDGTGDCQTCADCAGNDTCSLEFTLCVLDQECIDYATCIQPCDPADQACFDNCAALYPFGSQEYYDYAVCVVCTACYSDCDGAGSGC